MSWSFYHSDFTWNQFWGLRILFFPFPLGKNSIHVKSEWQKNPKISTMCIMISLIFWFHKKIWRFLNSKLFHNDHEKPFMYNHFISREKLRIWNWPKSEFWFLQKGLTKFGQTFCYCPKSSAITKSLTFCTNFS